MNMDNVSRHQMQLITDKYKYYNQEVCKSN